MKVWLYKGARPRTRTTLALLTVSVLGVLISTIAPSLVSANSLSISPLRQELELKPGQTFTSSVHIRNTSTAASVIKLNAGAFNVTNENYDYSFVALEKPNNWVVFTKPEVGLKPGQEATVDYSVGIPSSAEPGERYIVLFASVKDKKTNAIQTINRAGLLMYITVAGNVSRHAKVIKVQLPSLTINDQADWSARINSTGTAHFHSRTTTNVTNINGHQVHTNTFDHLILPKTTRRIDGSIRLNPMPGLYKVTFVIGRGDDPAFTQSKWVLYAPIWFIVLLLVVVIAIIQIIRRILSKRKKKD